MIFMKVTTGIDVKLRAFSPALNRAVKSAVLKWFNKVFPGHFKTSAYGKYRYQLRSRKYENRKMKVQKSRSPLVYSGYARKILNLHMRVTGTKGNVTGKFTTNQRIKYIWKHPKNHPDKIKELKTLTDQELDVMNLDIKVGTVRDMNMIKKRKTIK